MLASGACAIPFYATIPAVAALPVPPGRKVVPSIPLVFEAEGTLPIPALVLGREAMCRYQRSLDPRTPSGGSGRS